MKGIIIEEYVCVDCKGSEKGCDGTNCDEYQIFSLCLELFGAEFVEKWDGNFPQQTGKLLRGLKGLKAIKDLSESLVLGEIK